MTIELTAAELRQIASHLEMLETLSERDDIRFGAYLPIGIQRPAWPHALDIVAVDVTGQASPVAAVAEGNTTVRRTVYKLQVRSE